MAGETSDELLERVRGGELDARRVLLTPEIAPGADAVTLESLLAAEPSVGELGDAGWARLDADRSARIGDLEADRRYWIADLLNFWQTAPQDVSQVTSPQDGMYARTPDLYFPTGALALRCVRLALFEARKETCESILDFACGYGRAMRFFRAAFPDARLTACDIAADAVDFCAQEFGAVPVYSQEDPTQIELPGPFDMIWVGSLFTHVPEHRWVQFFDLLGSVLADDGLLVFTVQGRHTRRQLAEGRLPWDLTDSDIEQIVCGFDETGYGYADWTGLHGYGTSLNRASWVCARIEERDDLALVGYREVGWGRQDVVTVQRRAR